MSHCRDKRTAAERGDERAQLALVLQHELFELVKLGLEVAAGCFRSFHRLEPKGRAGEKLHDAIVEVAGQHQAGSTFCAFFRGLQQRVPLDMRGDIGADLLGEIDMIGR